MDKQAGDAGASPDHRVLSGRARDGLGFGGLARLFGLVNLYGAASSMSTVDSFVGDVLYLALIVFSVLAVVRVLRGKDAGLPFIAKMAGGDFTAAIKPKARTAEASVHTASPVQAAPRLLRPLA